MADNANGSSRIVGGSVVDMTIKSIIINSNEGSRDTDR